jgi:2-oxoisovalerate dehydrogenase E1 component
MATFKNKEQLLGVMKELWECIRDDKGISEQLLESRLIVRFIFREPDGILTIDGSDGNDIKIIVENTDVKPTLEMEMKSDFAHQFWLGKENVAAAMLQGKIVSRGPVNKALKLLPAIRPAFRIYPRVLKEAM